MNNFAIITNEKKDVNYETTKKIEEFLLQQGKKVFLLKEFKKYDFKNDNNIKKICEEMECAIILGGDGTIIHSARELAIHKVPIIGVNLGTLGFLSEVEKEDAIDVLKKILLDEFIVEERMMISANINSNNQDICAGIALNDIVISRGGFSRIIELEIYVNDQMIDIYYADGVIISTPTGSTAYNLSAGGPILNPTTQMMVITPICPHSLTTRSIVVAAKDKVCIRVKDIRSKVTGDVKLTLDGQIGYSLNENDLITLTRSEYVTKLLKLYNNNFYSLLRKKIGCHK